MTKRRGPRPRDDTAVVEVALALQVGLDLSQRKAIDIALALIEGELVEPTKVPRGAKRKKGGTLVGYRLALGASFAGRNATIRRKVKNVDPAVIIELARLLLEALGRKKS